MNFLDKTRKDFRGSVMVLGLILSGVLVISSVVVYITRQGNIQADNPIGAQDNRGDEEENPQEDFQKIADDDAFAEKWGELVNTAAEDGQKFVDVIQLAQQVEEDARQKQIEAGTYSEIDESEEFTIAGDIFTLETYWHGYYPGRLSHSQKLLRKNSVTGVEEVIIGNIQTEYLDLGTSLLRVLAQPSGDTTKVAFQTYLEDTGNPISDLYIFDSSSSFLSRPDKLNEIFVVRISSDEVSPDQNMFVTLARDNLYVGDLLNNEYQLLVSGDNLDMTGFCGEGCDTDIKWINNSTVEYGVYEENFKNGHEVHRYETVKI